MLLPPDLRDWLPGEHLVWLVLQVVDELDLSQIEGRYRRGGVGRQAYDPGMLTAVLIYAYCVGMRSSRAIERACLTDVALRVASGQQRPDHTTIARFRASHAEALAGLFTQVLAICGRAGLGRVGIVAIDGTKIAANASRAATVDEPRLRKLAAKVLSEAEQVDAAEDAAEDADRDRDGGGGGGLPETLRPGPDRAARIRAALADLEAERAGQAQPSVDAAQAAVDRAAAKAAAVRRRVAERKAAWHARDAQLRAATGHGVSGTRPVQDPDQHVSVRRAEQALTGARERLELARAGQRVRARTRAKTLRRNLTDLDSRVMATRTAGFVQGYNAQLAVTDDHLIVATDVVQATNDTEQFIPMAAAAQAGADVLNAARGASRAPDGPHTPSGIGVLVADAGYYSNAALTAPGPDRLIAVGRNPAKAREPRKPPPQLLARLQPDHPDRARYDRRKATVEPVIGQLKDRLGLRRFSRRGLQAVRHELTFTALAFNLHRLHATT
jgi:transposase